MTDTLESVRRRHVDRRHVDGGRVVSWRCVFTPCHELFGMAVRDIVSDDDGLDGVELLRCGRGGSVLGGVIHVHLLVIRVLLQRYRRRELLVK